MSETKKKQRRLPKFKRDPKGYDRVYGAFELTERDYRIMEYLLEHRYLTLVHVVHLLEKPGQDGRGRLSKRWQGLYHHSYAQRKWPNERMRFERGSRDYIQVLDRKGAEALCEWMSARDDQVYTIPKRGQGRETDIRWRPEYATRTSQHMLHGLMTADVLTAFEVAARSHQDYELEDVMHDGEWSGQVTTAAGEVFQVRPDGYVLLGENGVAKNLFIECDRSKEESTVIQEKYENYLAYLGSTDFQEFPNPSKVRVLFITTGEERLQNMMGYLDDLEIPERRNRSIFWFTTRERFSLAEPQRILFAPIWQTLTMDKELSLAIPAD